jgi:tRNA uridine 5-carboxymethylaminomethyl modification enzyme
MTYTSEKTHEVVRRYLHLSPIKTGSISGHGPRYCPSIDRKVMNFPDRGRHPVFVEPEGRRTKELYLQGLTTSLPVWVQEKVIQATPGLETARIMRPGYAVEYDYVVPDQLQLTLETTAIGGLFLAGQINGTSGYEEAAAQGLMAGINAARRVKDLEPLVLRRDQAYIGVLIDDLVTKGVDEPYRMFTSRAEFRLLLRHDNAHERLSQIGKDMGLLPDASFEQVKEFGCRAGDLVSFLKETMITPSDGLARALEAAGTPAIPEPQSAWQLLKRPEIFFDLISPFFNGVKGGAGESPEINDGLADRARAIELRKEGSGREKEVIRRAEIEARYEGYIARQQNEVDRRRRLEETPIPAEMEFSDLHGLTIEAREKLSRVRPSTLGQASRIAGVSPADVSVLSLYLHARRAAG